MKLSSWNRVLRPVVARAAAVVSIGRLLELVSGKPAQRAEVTGMNDERRSGCPSWQPWGFRSLPPAGAPALLVSIGGMRAGTQVVHIADIENGPTDQDEGDTEIYCPVSGARARFCADGRILIDSPGFVGVTSAGPVTVNAQGPVQVTSQEGVSVVAGGSVGVQTDGNATVVAAGSVNLTAPNVVITGNLTVAGDIDSTGEVNDSSGTMTAMRTVYASHIHQHSQGPTGTPTPPTM